MYEDMLTNNYDQIMIFEDDAVPDSERLAQIPQILSEIPGDCELLMWGWSKNGKSDINTILKKAVYNIQYSLGILKWDHGIIKNLFARPYSSHLKKAGFHDYTYAYAITKSAAEKLLQMQTPIQYIADNLLAHAVTNNLVNGYIVYPPAFLHDNLPDGSARDSYIR
jgi:GR25 family glycosyltransferase involved in LPS biosynthesis